MDRQEVIAAYASTLTEYETAAAEHSANADVLNAFRSIEDPMTTGKLLKNWLEENKNKFWGEEQTRTAMGVWLLEQEAFIGNKRKDAALTAALNTSEARVKSLAARLSFYAAQLHNA